MKTILISKLFILVVMMDMKMEMMEQTASLWWHRYGDCIASSGRYYHWVGLKLFLALGRTLTEGKNIKRRKLVARCSLKEKQYVSKKAKIMANKNRKFKMKNRLTFSKFVQYWSIYFISLYTFFFTYFFLCQLIFLELIWLYAIFIPLWCSLVFKRLYFPFIFYLFLGMMLSF